jgi:glycosyltransferase involved in cell wall biosynthesis
MSANTKSLRVLGVTANPITIEDGKISGKSAGFYQALSRRYTLVDIIVAKRGPIGEGLHVLTSLRPTMKDWRRMYHRDNPVGFHQRTSYVENAIQKYEGQYDVIFQVHTLQAPGTKYKERPYVLTTDNTHVIQKQYWPQPMSDAKSEEFIALERSVFQNAKYLFPWGSYVRQSMIEDYDINSERVFAFGTGSNFNSGTLNKDNYGNQIALMVGRDFERKGGKFILEAWKTVHKNVPNAQLWIVGPDKPSKETGMNVTWYGLLHDREKVRGLFEQATLFVMPSLFEPWGHVFLEAMGVGLPCIGADHLSMPDMITTGENGILVPPGKAEPLAQALIELLCKPQEAKRMGYNAFQRVTSYYNWDALIERMAPYIEDAAGS